MMFFIQRILNLTCLGLGIGAGKEELGSEVRRMPGLFTLFLIQVNRILMEAQLQQKELQLMIKEIYMEPRSVLNN